MIDETMNRAHTHTHDANTLLKHSHIPFNILLIYWILQIEDYALGQIHSKPHPGNIAVKTKEKSLYIIPNFLNSIKSRNIADKSYVFNIIFMVGIIF